MLDGNDVPGEKPQRIDLAERAAIVIGATRIAPSLRRIEARGTVTLEPRVMQVLVALYDGNSAVVSRQRLVGLCWGGLVVGDDAINRAIMELRRAAARVSADFAIETIPRIGYRLNRASAWSPGTSRDPAAQALIDEARAALRPELPPETHRAIALLNEAHEATPGDAEILGLLAMAWRNVLEFAPSDAVSGLAEKSDRIARAAIRLYPDEGHALTALATLRPYMGDWIDSERRLSGILDVAPDTLPALSHLTTLYQSSGLLGRSKEINDKALEIDPMSPVFLFRDAMKRWIFRDVSGSDMAIDRTLRIWPRHPAVWNIRLVLYAYTGRAAAGLEFLGNRDLGPAVPSPEAVHLWQVSLRALATRTSDDIDRAVDANLAAVRAAEGHAANAMMTLSQLGRIDEAFVVAKGYFVGQGPAVTRPFDDHPLPLADQLWKRSMMLFTPATLPMRRDPRFGDLCDAIGLQRFWNETGYVPDFEAFDALGPASG